MILKEALVLADNVEGDFAEFGVWRGGSFYGLAERAQMLGKKAFAFDSFVGMDEPQRHDFIDGETTYPKGRFDVGGTESFMRGVRQRMLHNVVVVEGFVPASFAKVSLDVVFAFAHVDLDHYLPTKKTLEWLWEGRLVKGGILVCDDWVPSLECSATLAIKEFLKDKQLQVYESGRTIWWVK